MTWQKLRQQVLERDNFQCQICLKQFDKLDIHHIICRRKGGLNIMNNLMSLCVKCHRILEPTRIKYFHPIIQKSISLKIETHAELTKLGVYGETIDDIIKKCIEAYKKENNRRND
jgi:HNH endonuclease